MGTFVDIAIVDGSDVLDDRAGARAIAAAFAAVDRVASLMSFHDARSDLSRLNARAHIEPVRVDAWTVEVLRIAQRLFVATDGHFDCTIGSCLMRAGLLPTGDRTVPNEQACLADVELMDDERVAYRAPLAIDLGGIAKGFAVDRAVDALRSHGVRAAVVNAGGDLRVLGDGAVPIFVRSERAAAPCLAGTLADGAFATSSCFDAASSGPARAPSGLVDPFARCLLATGKTYSVIAPTCAIADGLTKALASADGLSERCLRSFNAAQLIH